MLDVDHRRVVEMAFDNLGRRKRSLAKAFEASASFHDVAPPPSVADLFSFLRFSDPNDPLRVAFGILLAKLDYTTEGDWAQGTNRSTQERRAAIHAALGLNAEQARTCDEFFPRYPAVDPPIVIVDDAHWTRWYTGDRRTSRAFYWPAYHNYLKSERAWTGKNLTALDVTTNDVLERLTDPVDPAAYQAKGLVVGYVQSGKTAHYTGLIAKAADAGYRMVIVLAGTINILRDQTQRRLDKELLGWELVEEDYEGDPEELQFLRHGGRPSEQGSFDWQRLTLAREDFQWLRVGLPALEFRRRDPTLPLYSHANLYPERARLLVVKKQATVLAKLLKELGRPALKTQLEQIPALIIDDESDQASINTRRPNAQEVKQRTAINKLIVRLLEMLPRAQYIGYTATPFANVFVDPSDAADLFPSDFLIGLPRPEGYMGVADFYDAGESDPTDYRCNRTAFVRAVVGEDLDQKNLPQAIDAFVLAGAMKLFRHNNGQRAFRHHTMLVHHSAYTRVHRAAAEEVERLFSSANYVGGGPGLGRLRDLWETDFSQVCRARSAGRLPVPGSFEVLRPFVGECCRRISEGPKPVLVVNGDDRDEAPNFEKAPVWKIIVGGTKLSRGYTVEGLTVSYYRRRANTADTLLQMGRWFGYRAGYEDLVRLYIGTQEPLDSKGKKFINLYEAFHAVCLDEEEFRADLARYGSLEPGQRITPKQVPPLVPSHMLKPTAPNKMYNAVLESENFGRRWVERTVAPSGANDVRKNQELIEELLLGRKIHRVSFGYRLDAEDVQFDAFVCGVDPHAMREFLAAYRWAPEHGGTLDRVLGFLSGLKGDPEIDRWLIVAPLTKSQARVWTVANVQLSERERSRVETGGRYGVFSEPQHVKAAQYLACCTELGNVTPDLRNERQDRQAVMLLYPVRSKEERIANRPVTVGFGLQLPENHLPRRVVYGVVRRDMPDAITVDKPQ